MKKKIICFLLMLVTFGVIVLNSRVAFGASAIADASKPAETSSAPAAAFTFSGTVDELASKGDAGSATTATNKVLKAIITLIQVIGTGVAIIMLTYVAIKYMTAAPDEKADFKKSATAYVVGAVVLFAASNIVKIIANFSSNIG